MTKPAITLLLILAAVFVGLFLINAAGNGGGGSILGGNKTLTLSYSDLVKDISADTKDVHKVKTANWQQNSLTGGLNDGEQYVCNVPEKDSPAATQLIDLLRQNPDIDFTFDHPPVTAMVISVLSVIAFPAMILAVIYFLLIRPNQLRGYQPYAFNRVTVQATEANQESGFVDGTPRYTVIFEKTSEGFRAYVPDLPGCIASADTLGQTYDLMTDAISTHLTLLRNRGEPIPEPVSIAMRLPA